MREIIKRGTKEVTTCKVCGCKFSYEEEDVFIDDISNYKSVKKTVACPQCESEIIIWQSKWGRTWAYKWLLTI